MSDGEIAIQAWFHSNPLGRWITLTIWVADTHRLDMVLDPGSPASAISPETATQLANLNLLHPPVDPRFDHRLASLSCEGHALPDVDVKVFRRLSRLGVDGLIGLNFLSRFERVRFHVPTLRLFLDPL